jgi:hypothetical protein
MRVVCEDTVKVRDWARDVLHHGGCNIQNGRTLLDWRSCHLDTAEGCLLGPSTAQEPQGRYMMTKMTLAHDVVDDNDDHYAVLMQIPPPKTR